MSRFLKIAAVIILLPILLEGALRLGAAVLGDSRLLYYGLPQHKQMNTIGELGSSEKGYHKYWPSITKYGVAFDGGKFEAHINGQGFRGAEFTEAKPGNTIRIAALGASSTFGFGVGDLDTYPAILEGILNSSCSDGHRYQVYNFGIPFQLSYQTLQLFRHEVLPFSPDLVTFYEGANDVSTLKRTRPALVLLSLRERLLLGLLLDEILLRLCWFDRADWEYQRTERANRFIANLDQLAAACTARQAKFILATQQLRSDLLTEEELARTSYAEEVELIRKKLGRGAIRADELYLLMHNELMEAAKRWASERSIPTVDAIAALDRQRLSLASWVHLTPAGNRLLAQTLAKEILDRTCRRPRSAVQ